MIFDPEHAVAFTPILDLAFDDEVATKLLSDFGAKIQIFKIWISIATLLRITSIDFWRKNSNAYMYIITSFHSLITYLWINQRSMSKE